MKPTPARSVTTVSSKEDHDLFSMENGIVAICSLGTYTSDKDFTIAKAISNLFTENFLYEGPGARGEFWGTALGFGIGKNLNRLRQDLENLKNNILNNGWRKGFKPKVFKIVGHSRGALQAVQMAHIIKEKYPQCKIELYLIDPVVGPADSIGVDKSVWDNKFKLPAGCKCMVQYSRVENRYIFSGVVSPAKFDIPEDVSFLSGEVHLNHASVVSPASENNSQERHNSAIRDAMTKFMMLEMGVITEKDITPAQKRIIKTFFEEGPSSAQRGQYNFHKTQHLENFSELTQKLAQKVTEKAQIREEQAEKIILLLSEYLLLSNSRADQRLINNFKMILTTDYFLRKIIPIIKNPHLTMEERVTHIYQMCQKDQDHDHRIVKAVKEILATPDKEKLSADNWLKDYHHNVCEYIQYSNDVINPNIRGKKKKSAETKWASYEGYTKIKMGETRTQKDSLLDYLKQILSRIQELIQYIRPVASPGRKSRTSSSDSASSTTTTTPAYQAKRTSTRSQEESMPVSKEARKNIFAKS